MIFDFDLLGVRGSLRGMSEVKWEKVLLEALNELREEGGHKPITEVDSELVLYGEGGILDSLGLVSLIVDLESRVEEETGRVVTLADDRAMSARRSPFRTMGSLAEHLRQQLSA